MEIKAENTKQQSTNSTLWFALSLAWEFGYTIALPLVVFGIAGRVGDRYFGTGPILLLVGIVASLIISSYLLYKKVSKYLVILNKEIEQAKVQTK